MLEKTKSLPDISLLPSYRKENPSVTNIHHIFNSIEKLTSLTPSVNVNPGIDDKSIEYSRPSDDSFNKYSQLNKDIFNICKKCSKLTREIVCVSPTYDLEKAHRMHSTLGYSSSDEYKSLKESSIIHDKFLFEWWKEIKKMTNEKPYIQYQIEALKFTLKSNTGNCETMALIVASFLKSIFPEQLNLLGYPNEIVESLKHKISIFESECHTIAILSFKLNNEVVEYVIDPWSDGAAFERSGIPQFYRDEDDEWSHCSENTLFEVDPQNSEIFNSKEYNDKFKAFIADICRIDLDNESFLNQFAADIIESR